MLMEIQLPENTLVFTAKVLDSHGCHDYQLKRRKRTKTPIQNGIIR
jgi:hypothetical protein